MPIDFPSNPSSGQTYSYAGQQWQFNGVAWDKLIIADDANALYGISGSIYASNLATGLLYGGIISINAGNSAHFDITAGRGQIHASGSTYTSGPFPTFHYVDWAGQTGITLTYLATSDTTWIYVDSAGIIQQRPTYYTDEQLEETIIIGQLVHPSRTFINLARTNPNVAYATDKQYEQFIRSFGPIKVSGHTISPNGANLKLNRTSGTAFSLGRNWINDTDNPSVVSDGAYTDCIFYRYYRGATAGTFITVPNQTAIDPTKYDNGTGTLATVPGGKYTIQRLFYYPNTPTLLGVYYGRAEYTSLADAAANINFENFTEIENTRTNAIFAGYLLVRSGTTDLSNTSDALILQSGNFRSTTSGGGSVSLTLDDLTDVIITSPQNYQVLAYVDGVTGWENLSVTSLPLVSSLRGLTGAVGITNGSGIGLSVSGNTLTVSNTGVLSIDGSTGTITNVAKTNVNNNFTAAQTIVSTSTLNTTTVSPTSLTHYYDVTGFSQLWQSAEANSTITFPNFTTTLAGLSGTQTFGGTKTFNTLTNFSAGISSAGGTFSALTRFTAGISASGGMTLAGPFQGATATFTGLVSSSVGFSGSATNLTGNASGLTAGTATRIIATGTNSASTFYPTFVGGAGNTGLFIDPTIGPLSYVPSTATLNLTNLNFGAGALTMNAFEVIASSYFYFIANNGIYLQDSTLVQIGDVTGVNDGAIIEVLPLANAVNMYTLTGAPIVVGITGGLKVSGGVTFNGTVSSDTGYRITSSAINAQTGTTYTLLESDNGKILTFSNASTTTVTVPTALPIGFNCTAIQLGAGQVGFTAASGVTLNSYGNQYKLIGQHASASIIEYTTDIVNLSGNLIV